MSLLLLVVQGADFTIPLTSFEIGELLSTIPLESSDWFLEIIVVTTVFIVQEYRKLLLSAGIIRGRTSRRN